MYISILKLWAKPSNEAPTIVQSKTNYVLRKKVFPALQHSKSMTQWDFQTYFGPKMTNTIYQDPY